MGRKTRNRPQGQGAAHRIRLDFFRGRRFVPVLTDKCYKCHSEKAEKVKGGLLLDTREGLPAGNGRQWPGGHPRQSKGQPAHRGDPLWQQGFRHASAEIGRKAARRRHQGFRKVGADGRAGPARRRRRAGRKKGRHGEREGLVGLSTRRKRPPCPRFRMPPGRARTSTDSCSRVWKPRDWKPVADADKRLDAHPPRLFRSRRRAAEPR